MNLLEPCLEIKAFSEIILSSLSILALWILEI